jgi:membrane protease YdiL (CAAX protease family)
MDSKLAQTSWKAKDAWICLLLLVAWTFVCNGGLSFFVQIFPLFASWLRAHFVLAANAISFLSDGYGILVAFLCSRALSVRTFVNDVGLSRRPTLSLWPFACGVIAVAFLAHYGASNGWASGNPLAHAYHKIGGEAWSFFQLYAISVGPFAEETILRGFLYRAFRGSYGIIISIILTICVASFDHWDMVSHSLFSLTCLSLGQILLCLIRERTQNTWNCVICHAAYNATLFLLIRI